jgi:hypothetical protein
MSLWLRGIAVAALMAGISGCALLPRTNHHFAAVRPVVPKQALNAPREDGYYASAKVAIERRDYARALELLQAAQTANPRDVRVLNAFGVVYDKLGRFDLSERYYLEAQALDPTSPVLANNMAWSADLREESGALQAQATSPVDVASAAAPAEAPAVSAAALPSGPFTLRRPPVIRLGFAAEPAPVRLAGRRGMLVVDASGQRNGAAPVVQRLVRLGWTPPRMQTSREARRTTQIVYPTQAAAVAKTLSRTLPGRVTLVDCGRTCQEVRLVLGSDAARWTAARATLRGRLS